MFAFELQRMQMELVTPERVPTAQPSLAKQAYIITINM
jgi:hypothetical protein